MQQKLFKDFFTQEAGTSGNNIVKEPQKPRPKLKLYILSFYGEYLLCLQSSASACSIKFVKHVLIF